MIEKILRQGTPEEWTAYYPEESGMFYVNKKTAQAWEDNHKKIKELEEKLNASEDPLEIGKMVLITRKLQVKAAELYLQNESEIIAGSEDYKRKFGMRESHDRRPSK